MEKKKIDWTDPTGQALAYFQSKGVAMDEIVEEIYSEINRMPQGRELMDIVEDKLIDKICERIEDDIENYDYRHGYSIALACTFYCMGKLVDGENYRNFYDFLAESRVKLRS